MRQLQKHAFKMLTTAVFCAIGLTAIAQDDKAKGNGMPQMGPTPEIKAIAYLAGTWNADFLMRMAPDAEWISAPSIQVFESILGGCAIRAHFSTSMMGMPFSGQATLTFDRNRNKWQMVWTDNLGAMQSLLEGEKVDGVVTLEGAGLEMGQAYLMRDITTHKSETEFDWQMDVSYDDGKNWFTQMKGTYKKAE